MLIALVVAAALIRNLVPSVMLVMVAPAGIPVPVIGMPGMRPAVVATVTELERLVVVPEIETADSALLLIE